MYRKKEEAEAFKTVSLSDGSKIGVKQFIMLFIPYTTQDILFIVSRGNTNTGSAKDETNNE